MRHICWILLAMLLCASCSDDGASSISLTTGSSLELPAVGNQTGKVGFNAVADWTASCDARWLTFSPKKGTAGDHTIEVTTMGINRTKAARTATLHITSDGGTRNVFVTQRGDYAFFDDDIVEVAAEGDVLSGLTFRTNLAEDECNLYATEGLTDWVLSPSGSARTRGESVGRLGPLTILPNESLDVRIGAFLLVKDHDLTMALDTLWIRQAGRAGDHQSTDFSADGQVQLLHKATQGTGIPVVLMGDGFTDRDIADGTYADVMQQTMDHLFSEEPVKSLRSYFNVYAVSAVSTDEGVGTGKQTALSAVPSAVTSHIDVNTGTVMHYVKQVEHIDSLNTLAVVVLNSSVDGGVTYLFRQSPLKPAINYAIALCPIIDSLKSEKFRQVLTHEAIGHGLGRLADEYVRESEGSATAADIDTLKNVYHKIGWLLNVDSEKDSTAVLWSRFIGDADYAAERIGTFEGGYTYYKGVYRPTERSMMNANDSPFNAPSRQAIYNKVMLLGEGREPGFEEFRAFDRQHQPEQWDYRTRAPWQPGASPRFAPPVIVYRK